MSGSASIFGLASCLRECKIWLSKISISCSPSPSLIAVASVVIEESNYQGYYDRRPHQAGRPRRFPSQHAIRSIPGLKLNLKYRQVSLGGLLGCSGGMWARETAGLQADCSPPSSLCLSIAKYRWLRGERFRREPPGFSRMPEPEIVNALGA